jgi:hypothetical protein
VADRTTTRLLAPRFSLLASKLITGLLITDYIMGTRRDQSGYTLLKGVLI